MLFYKIKEGLTSSIESIDSPQVILKLYTEVKANFTAVIVLNNNSKLAYPFDNEGEIFKCKFEITKETIPYLTGAKLYLHVVDSGLEKNSNEVLLKFNQEKIKASIKKVIGEEVVDLTQRMSKLESELVSLSKKGILKNAPVINKADIKPGMIPVATASGEFTAAYPFADVVKEVNGIKAINERLLITLKDIPYEENGKSTKEVVQLLLTIVKAQAEVIQDILKTQSKIIEDLQKLRLDYAEHKSTALF
jgi:hypothetical protein